MTCCGFAEIYNHEHDVSIVFEHPSLSKIYRPKINNGLKLSLADCFEQESPVAKKVHKSERVQGQTDEVK